jgi:WD40 repeat protein
MMKHNKLLDKTG